VDIPFVAGLVTGFIFGFSSGVLAVLLFAAYLRGSR